MTEEEKLYQHIAEGKPLDREMFQDSLAALLPQAEKEAVPIWAEFAQECVDAQERADGPELVQWYDSLLAGFIQIKQEYGADIAAEVCDLSLKDCCLYPYEMNRTALELHEGGDFDDLVYLMMEGELEDDPPVFPKLRDVLAPDAAEPQRQMNME